MDLSDLEERPDLPPLGRGWPRAGTTGTTGGRQVRGVRRRRAHLDGDARRTGCGGLADCAAPQLIRWKRRYGWTRFGEGWVAERERSLAEVLAPMLADTDAWGTFAAAHVRALDGLATIPGASATVTRRANGHNNLAQWHAMLLERPVDMEYEPLLDDLAAHPALPGSRRTFLDSRLAHLRVDDEPTRRLIASCLKDLPGHSDHREFALVLEDSPEPSS